MQICYFIKLWGQRSCRGHWGQWPMARPCYGGARYPVTSLHPATADTWQELVWKAVRWFREIAFCVYTVFKGIKSGKHENTVSWIWPLTFDLRTCNSQQMKRYLLRSCGVSVVQIGPGVWAVHELVEKQRGGLERLYTVFKGIKSGKHEETVSWIWPLTFDLRTCNSQQMKWYLLRSCGVSVIQIGPGVWAVHELVWRRTTDDRQTYDRRQQNLLWQNPPSAKAPGG